jgi:nitroreductase
MLVTLCNYFSYFSKAGGISTGMSTDTLPAVAELADLKAAQTAQPVHELISRRWSPRAFSEREVTSEQLVSLLEAARWATSSYNEQPWRFIVARKSDPETYDKLLGSLMELNQLWARSAPVLILSLAKKTFTHNGTPNLYAMHDAGMAFSNLALQATALGLSVHFMGGFNRAAARTAFHIPDDYELGAVAAIGYAGDPETLPENFRQAELTPRTRKPLAELVYAGQAAVAL